MEKEVGMQNRCGCFGPCADAGNRVDHRGDNQDNQGNQEKQYDGPEALRSCWGRGVASAAVKEMNMDPAKTNEKSQADRQGFCEDEIKSFMQECAESGKKAYDVIEHICRREGFSLDVAPIDAFKRRMWDFLRAVVEYTVEESSEDGAQLSVRDAKAQAKETWRNLLEHVANRRFGRIFDLRDERPGENSLTLRPLVVKNFLGTLLGW